MTGPWALKYRRTFKYSTMADHVDRTTRSAIMSKVRSKNTTPEIAVRKALHTAGYRFRLHRTDLPGKPDIVLPKFRVALFVHGCFWHRHGCQRTTMPSSNVQYWSKKFRRTLERDQRAYEELNKIGWTATVIWECQLQSGLENLLHDLASRVAGSPDRTLSGYVPDIS